MHGNAFEWCNEWYKEDANSARKPEDVTGRQCYARRVLKGGSMYNYARHCRSAYSFSQIPRFGGGYIGVRVILQVVE